MRISDNLAAAVIPACLLVAGALYTGASVVSELLDDHGRVVMDADGEPVLVQAAWETWKLNWLPNVLLLLGAAVLLRFFWQEVSARYAAGRTVEPGADGR